MTLAAERALHVDPAAADLLKPYVPRLVINWLRTMPDERHLELDSSLVFVDISGFTALTERLARKGKIGAELMRDTLDGVFTALLDEAYEWGAGLLKWGGDALLLLFDGPDHELRACRAAWEMQRTIDRVGRLHVSGGTVVLRMSVGIGTGAFHFFMTGSVHRELLIAGPAMTETLVMEGIADAGEIGLSPTLAARLDPGCLGPSKDGAILLAAPPAVDRGRAGDVGDVSGLDIASCIPIAARAHVMSPRKPEPEHRTITAAFIDLMDTDRLLEELGPEALAAALDIRITAIQEAALRYEVPFYETDVGKSSVKALLTAGAPSSTGRDEERMLRALRDIMDEPGIVPVRVGVNTGKVFTGDFGPFYRRAYRVFGDAINTAARVMSKAGAGEILSTDIVLDHSRTIFDTTPIPPFAAKGKSEPVRASLVGPAIGVKQAQSGMLDLIGRETELGAIVGVLDQVRFGTGWTVEISGDPGMGKSRLVDEVIARALDFRVLRARCEEYESATPYFPMRAIMRAVVGLEDDAEADDVAVALAAVVSVVDPGLAPWIPLLGLLIGVDLPHTRETKALDARFLRERLAEVVTTFLDMALTTAPVVVVVEDAQHMDEATRDLVQRLAAAEGASRRLLILTRQSEEPILAMPPGNDRLIALDLQPLTPAQMEELINLATEDAPLRPHEVEVIARRSAGNTLFLFELLQTVRATGTIESLPDSVESLIAGEIDRLDPGDRTLLRYAAVLGASVDPDLLIDVVRDDVELRDGIWDRVAGLLGREPNGTLRFRNTLIRDAAYEGLPYRRRRVLHDRVGAAIEARAGTSTDEEMGVLALHFREAQRWDKAWAYGRQAGDRAMKIYAIADAGRFYEGALTAGRRLRSVHAPELADLYGRWSDALYLLGRYEEADRALRRAKRLVKLDPIEVAPLAIKQAIISTRTGQFRQASARVTRALRPLMSLRGEPAAAARARLMVVMSGTRYLQNRRRESIRWARDAEREAQQSDARDALADAYKLLDLALMEIGQVDQAVYSGRALELYEELDDRRSQAMVLNNLGLLEQERSEWDKALQLYRRFLEIMELTGDRANGSLAKYNIAEILVDQGRLDEAEVLLREVIRVWRASGNEADAAEARREMGKLFARRGEFEVARDLLEAAHAEQVRDGKLGEALGTAVRQCETDVLAGDPAALARIQTTEQLARRDEGGSAFAPILQRLQGWALLQRGEHDAGEAVLQAALASARTRGDGYEVALVLDALVALGSRRGSDVEMLVIERTTQVEQLGIERLPSFPIEPERPPDLPS